MKLQKIKKLYMAIIIKNDIKIQINTFTPQLIGWEVFIKNQKC